MERAHAAAAAQLADNATSQLVLQQERDAAVGAEHTLALQLHEAQAEVAALRESGRALAEAVRAAQTECRRLEQEAGVTQAAAAAANADASEWKLHARASDDLVQQLRLAAAAAVASRQQLEVGE
jgi:hypothetical protein